MRKHNYINNKDLYLAMKLFKKEVRKCLKENKEPPQISNYIGNSILLICNNLAKKPNFSGYTYKQEMISDAVVDCVASVENFDPKKTNNPFAYFTQIAWNAFIRRIFKEKKQSYVKHKNFENTLLFTDIDNEDLVQMKPNEFSNEIIRSFEEKTLTKLKKTYKIKGVEKFYS